MKIFVQFLEEDQFNQEFEKLVRFDDDVDFILKDLDNKLGEIYNKEKEEENKEEETNNINIDEEETPF